VFGLKDYPKTPTKSSMLGPYQIVRKLGSDAYVFDFLTTWVLVIFSMWRISPFIEVFLSLLVFLLVVL